MDKILKKKWVSALKSGKYKQTGGTLHDSVGYCCLGVLLRVKYPREKWENIIRYKNGNNSSLLSSNMLTEVGFDKRTQDRLSVYNDNYPRKNGKNFTEIGTWINKSL